MSQPPPAPALAAPSRRRIPSLLRLPGAAFGSLLRRPGRTAAVLLLLALAGLGLFAAGAQLWAAYHLRAARADLARYHNADADAHLSACLKVRPDDPDVLFLAARARRRAGQYDEAEDFLNRCQEQRGRDDALVLERALLTAERGDVDDVGNFCRAKIAADDPATPLILEAMGRGFLRGFRFGDAYWCAKTWAEREPDSAAAYLLLGRVADERLVQSDAILAYRRALELDPELDEARDRLALMLLGTNQGSEALPHLDYLRRRRPDDLGLMVHQARAYDLLGKQDEAARLLDEVLRRDPDFAPALTERGKLDMRPGGNLAEAEARLRRAVALAPWDVLALQLLYKCLNQMGQTEQAEALSPRLKQMEEDIDRIHRLATKTIQDHPHDADAQYEAGVILLRAGSVRNGIRFLERAVRLNPKHAKAHEALADAYQGVGDAARAAKHRQAAREAKGEAAK